MGIVVHDLASACGDSFVTLHGDSSAVVDTIASLSSARPGALIFVNTAEAKLSEILANMRSGVIIATSPIIGDLTIPKGCAVIECKNARLAFARCVKSHFQQTSSEVGVHPTAVIEPDCNIDETAYVGAHCYIGTGCHIGANTRVFPNTTILDGVWIGSNATINSGTVIGADGYGYEINESGRYEKFPHVGSVIIEDGVDIGANSCIDRGVLDNTIIRKRAKVDNLVHVSHNVDIGEDAMVIACTMLGGSVKIGKKAWIAPGSSVINQKKIGSDAVVGLCAVVTKNVADGQTVMGSPAIDQKEFRARSNAVKALLA